MIGEFLVYDEMENISMDEISIYSRKPSRQKFHNELACVFTAALRKQKCRLKSTTTNGWRHFGQSKLRKSFLLFPIQSGKSPDSGFFTCDPTNKCIMLSLH